MSLINALTAWAFKKDPSTNKDLSLLRVLSSTDVDTKLHTNDFVEVDKTLFYVGKSNRNDLWVVTENTGDKDLAIRYATISNNPTKTTYIDAWNDRLNLTYNRIENV